MQLQGQPDLILLLLLRWGVMARDADRLEFIPPWAGPCFLGSVSPSLSSNMARLLSLGVVLLCATAASATNCTSYKSPLANQSCISTCLPFGGVVLTNTSIIKNSTCYMKVRSGRQALAVLISVDQPDNMTADYVEAVRVDSGAACVYKKKNASVTTSTFYCCCAGS